MANRHTTVQSAVPSSDSQPGPGYFSQPLVHWCQPCHEPQLSQRPLLCYGLLCQQLDVVGWDRVTELSPDLRCLKLQLHDAAGRCHQAEVTLPESFPIAPPSVSMQLPSPLKTKWLPGDTLATLTAQLEKLHDAASRCHQAEVTLPESFPITPPNVSMQVPSPLKTKWLPGDTLATLTGQALASFQALWEQLEDLDSNTQLLDPAAALAKPYSYCSRCIALGNGASCQLKLSPAAPRALPSGVLFHGPSNVVAALQNSWYSSAHKLWQEQLSVRLNLEAILQVSLPAPAPGSRKGCAAALAAAGGQQDSSTAVPQGSDEDSSDLMDEDDDAGTCAICYALHLPDPTRPDELGAAPSISCPAVHCSRVFHAACLAEWLGGLPTSRRVFDTIFGSCPFCQSPIGVSTRGVVGP